MSHIDCNECKDLFGNKHNTMDLQVDPEHLVYTEILDRGRLIYPSNLLFKVLQVAYNIFNLCVASDLEGSFLGVKNQKYTLIGVIEQHLSNNDDFIGIYYTCDECDVTYFTRLLRALMCFSNICLNNYSKNMSDRLTVHPQVRNRVRKRQQNSIDIINNHNMNITIDYRIFISKFLYTYNYGSCFCLPSTSTIVHSD